jgi:heat-inducible transcriptional repressor
LSELSHRAKQILYAAVTEFVATGEPVGSRTLAKRGIELSPASIRNVLADLEEAGYLRQPHTSAGRVPTDRAFRLFIDALMQLQELSQMERAKIEESFERLEPGEDVLHTAGRLLSELTGTAAVVVSPRAPNLTLKHMRFIRTVPGQVLAVLVMSNGAVQNRFLAATVSEDDLVRIHNLLDDVIEGRSLGDLRDLFARRLQTERVRQDELRRRAFALGEAAVAGVTNDTKRVEVVIEGRSKLLDLPEFADASGIKDVVAALDEQQKLIELLDATVAAKGTSVVVGSEAGQLGGGQLAIVGATYTDHGRTSGSVGVIGPTRMDYPKVVPLVSATANAMSAFMGRASAGMQSAPVARDDGDDAPPPSSRSSEDDERH